jgi:signal transduction histidine kinase
VAVITALLRGALALLLFGVAAVGYVVASGRTDRPPVWWVVGVTVVVAIVLWWLEVTLERIANRLVHRERADVEARMDHLLQSMSEALPVDDVVVRLAELAGRNRQRAEVRVWLADGTSWGQAWPAQAPQVEAAYRVDVRHRGDRVGEIEIAAGAEPLTPLDRRLLDELAAPAGVALSTVRLTVDLRRREAQLTDLTRALAASSDRLRGARVEQQRRMRSEVDRRVLPHVRAARARLTEAGQPDTAAARREASAALDELRTLARGIHPPRLAEDGLVASLDGWMERWGRRVTITGDVVDALSEPVLRVAYFCVVTLLDALAEADAERLALSIADDGDSVQLQICGRVRPTTTPEQATVQLAQDRLEAFDGTLTVSWAEDTVSYAARLQRDPIPAS